MMQRLRDLMFAGSVGSVAAALPRPRLAGAAGLAGWAEPDRGGEQRDERDPDCRQDRIRFIRPLLRL